MCNGTWRASGRGTQGCPQRFPGKKCAGCQYSAPASQELVTSQSASVDHQLLEIYRETPSFACQCQLTTTCQALVSEKVNSNFLPKGQPRWQSQLWGQGEGEVAARGRQGSYEPLLKPSLTWGGAPLLVANFDTHGFGIGSVCKEMLVPGHFWLFSPRPTHTSHCNVMQNSGYPLSIKV